MRALSVAEGRDGLVETADGFVETGDGFVETGDRLLATSDVPRARAASRPDLRIVVQRLGLVALLVAFDLWSKAAVFAWLEGSDELVRSCCDRGHERYMILGEHVGWLAFMLSRNPGAAFGGFAEWPHLLVAGRVLAALFLAWLVLRAPARRPWFALALVLVFAGALGNLYDNLFLEATGGHPYGRVRDFIDVYFDVWKWHFPTFNFADSCITVGAVLLLLTGLGRASDGDGALSGSAGEKTAAA